MELTIVGIAHGGTGVARLDGRVVFVANSIPGERVRARLLDESKKSFARADVIDVLETSPYRQDHVWPEAAVTRAPEARPGGADFGHIVLAHQRDLKAVVIREALQRFGRESLDVVVRPVEGDTATSGLGWRTRETLHVNSDGVLGPRGARSHDVIEVSTLPLATKSIAERAFRHEPLRASQDVTFIESDLGVAVVERGSGVTPTVPIVSQRVGDHVFRMKATSFWQVHHSAAEVLRMAVTRTINPDLLDDRATHFDLYGGVGLFAQTLSNVIGPTSKVVSVEVNEEATDFAAENLARWVGARAVTASVSDFLTQLAQSRTATERSRGMAGTVVLDPPRSGAGRDVLASLCSLSPAQVIYVACDPVAFARDVQFLREGGYVLAHLEAHDLFPNTHHVELVARFEPRTNQRLLCSENVTSRKR